VNVSSPSLKTTRPNFTKFSVRVIHGQWRKSGSKSGGRQGKARRAELRAEASKPVGARGNGVLGKGCAPSPPDRGYGCVVSFRLGSGANGDLAIFVDFGTQEVILDDLIIQSQCYYSILYLVQISINKRHTALLSTLYVLQNSGEDEHYCRPSQYKLWETCPSPPPVIYAHVRGRGSVLYQTTVDYVLPVCG